MQKKEEKIIGAYTEVIQAHHHASVEYHLTISFSFFVFLFFFWFTRYHYNLLHQLTKADTILCLFLRSFIVVELLNQLEIVCCVWDGGG